MQFRKRTMHIGMGDDERKARLGSIGGSDARIIMSGDQRAIEALWAEKRGEAPPEDLSGVLLIALGNVTEPVNVDWFEHETGLYVTDEQKKVFYPEWEFAHATLDGLVRESPDSDPIGIIECKFMLPFNFSEDKAVEKYYAQLQHNMMVTGTQKCWLSIITGAGQHCVREVAADIFYQIELLEALKDFWDCVLTGRTPGVPQVEVSLAERIHVVDMTGNNEWASLAHELAATKTPAEQHDKAKKEILKLFPNDAKEASGYGIKISLTKDGKRRIDISKEEISKANAANGIVEPVTPSKSRAQTKKAA
jgi:predicted phage-related endonuclease